MRNGSPHFKAVWNTTSAAEVWFLLERRINLSKNSRALCSILFCLPGTHPDNMKWKDQALPRGAVVY